MADILSGIFMYLEVTIIGLLVFPLAFRFFPRLSTRGFALVRPLGLLVWGYLFWLLSYLGFLQNDLGGQMVALLLLGIIIVLLTRIDGIRKSICWLKENRKLVIAVELVGLVFFAFWVLVRGMNPDVAYTEKPMELAFINAILRSDSFPPYDPWLSGYAISYYYGGYILLAMLIRFSGVAASVGFNLGSALWFSLTAVATYGIMADLIHAWLTRNDYRTTEPQDSSKKQGSLIGALLGPFFILIASTWEGVLEILYSGGAFWKVDDSGQLISRFWSWLSINDLTRAPSQPFNWLPVRESGWLWWRGSRVIQDLNMFKEHVEVIDEFPFFTFLLSDMHPHLLALPFVLLAIGLCLNLFLDGGGRLAGRRGILSRFQGWETWLAAFLLGSLAFINTWDFPIYVGLYCLVVFFYEVRKFGFLRKVFINFLLNGIIFGLLGGVLFFPFYIGFGSQAGGFLPSLEFMTRGVHFWILFGVLLIPLLAWLFHLLRQTHWKRYFRIGLLISGGVFLGLLVLMLGFGLLLFSFQSIGPSLAASANSSLSGIGIKLTQAGNAFAGVHGDFSAGEVVREALWRRLQSPGTWLTLLVMLSIVTALLTDRDEVQIKLEDSAESGKSQSKIRVEYFILLLVLLGAGLTTLPEFFYLRDQFGWRMNTIFKFYFQTWVVWGLAAGFASVVLLKELRRWKGGLFQVTWIISAMLGLAYPFLMLWNKTDGFSIKNWRLDGNNYLATYFPDDYAAIQWLQKQPIGVVAEAVGNSYTDYARIATRTGFPTVLGWPGHESQWRGGGTEMGSRYADIQRLYESTDWSEVDAVIRMYNIRYIYIGYLELTAYRVETGKFNSHLEIVYQNQGTTIYEVPETMRLNTP